MGLLDDAIREHLDLKRRHGADPQEVEQAEQEALGPVRRGVEDVSAENGELEPELAQGDELDYGDDTEPGWSDEWEQEPESPAPDAPAAPGIDAGRTPEPPLPEAPPEPQTTPDPHPAPAPAPAGQEPKPFDHGDETAEYDVEGELEKEDHKEGEDVLEETPEFLQDTPDHDRLWFEQRPPRDFDFDG
jgi:hypothetical protein